jgi:protein TonB
MLLSILAAAALAAEPVVPAVRAQLKGTLTALVTPADYPAAAIAARQQGHVSFTLSIDEAGRPDRCWIVESSGSAQLDRVSCSVAVRRARFIPARDASGNAVRDEFAGELEWTLP